jgi:xanthine dehydrogenase accessory factor
MTKVFAALAELENKNRLGVLCMVIGSRGSTPRSHGSKMLVYEDGSIVGTVGGGELENRVRQEALEAIRDGKTRFLTYNMVDPEKGDPGVCGGTVEIYVEPIIPKPKIIIIGAGHVGKAVAHLAHWLDFYVVVSDDRPEFCNEDAVPSADEYLSCEMKDVSYKTQITPWTYLVLTTRGGDVDVEGLPALLETPAAYLGVIGSKRRWSLTVNKLLEKGVPSKKLDQIRSPIGLDLKAETPEEIALSIMAEIIMLYHDGTGDIMSQNNN